MARARGTARPGGREAGNTLSAGRKYLRSGLYYLLAERMPSHKDPRRLDAYKRGIALYRRGLELRRDPIEYVEVPFGNHKLPAIFSKAPVPGRAPCVVHFDGLDVTKELIYPSVADEFRRRGVSVLIVDHPGWAQRCVCSVCRAARIPRSRQVPAWITWNARRCRS
jgi:hypothetical protein